MADFSKLFESGYRADIVFSVDGENILAHSLIVNFWSPVFKTMFDESKAPKDENDEKPVIKINDERISAKDFRTFLLFLYNNKAEITGQNAFALLNMAKMYDVTDLFKLCEEFLTKIITRDNAFALLNIAKMYDVPDLFKLCEEFLTKMLDSENVVAIANYASTFHNSEVFKNAVEFIATKSFVLRNEQKYFGMNNEVFSAVLKQDKISTLMDQCSLCHLRVNGNRCSLGGRAAPTEIDLFNLMLKWGQNQCKLKNLEETPENLREVLKSCLPFIRFPTMTIDELTDIVYPTKLLDDTTMLAVFVDANKFARKMPDFTDAFSLSKTADIAFCVNGKKILADKFVLYHRSPVFATMFDGPLAPKSENGEKPVIPINDESITAENFKIFLLYLYSDKAEVTGDNAFTLMNLGKMYDVPSLISFVGKFLINNLTSENVVTIANSASIFNDDEILKNSVDFITKKCDVLKSEQQFCQLNEQVLSMVLNKDEGNLFCHSSSVENGLCHICGNAPTFSEIDLFKMLLKWGENQCITKGIQPIPQNLKTVLKEFLPLIRFPTMTINQLVTVVCMFLV
uniref:BTB domain-containing protein n=1 Tax=Panagrolaimus sp. JU765 TaxID=591449 RepID=A0AC34Q0S0_9BILA